MPEFATVQQNLDRLATELERELIEREEEVDAMFQEYQARELLYSQEERQQQREEIVRAEQELERLQDQYFGPEGEFYQQQDEMMRPIQERILASIEEVANEEGYDYIFDRSGDFLFLYAGEEYNLSDRVLEKLGIDIEGQEVGQ
jgi:outer membrane protein